METDKELEKRLGRLTVKALNRRIPRSLKYYFEFDEQGIGYNHMKQEVMKVEKHPFFVKELLSKVEKDMKYKWMTLEEFLKTQYYYALTFKKKKRSKFGLDRDLLELAIRIVRRGLIGVPKKEYLYVVKNNERMVIIAPTIWEARKKC